MKSAGDAGAVRAMYDALSRYVQLENWRAHGSRFADFTMHKALAVEEPSGAPFAATRRVNDALLEHCTLPANPSVLDAGCGFGGTIFHLHERLGGRYDGLTLSRVQLRVARGEARRRGIAGACRFGLRSFNEPIAQRYDAVVAIESLAHAPDLRRTLLNLASALVPGGALLLVEDMASADIDAKSPEEAELLRAHWGCGRFPRQRDYDAFLREAGLVVTVRVDLTRFVPFRSPATLERLARRYAALSRWLPIAPIRRVLSAYQGGVALERLYARQHVRYQLIVARTVATPPLPQAEAASLKGSRL
jgi:cyclopropane fatty-acyl-phospholipid synthase-like methyltransferase